MVYSVEQVARELNISKQAVYKKLNKEELKQYIVMVDGIKHLSIEGLNTLKGVEQRFNESERSQDDSNPLNSGCSTNSSKVENSLIEHLEKLIKSKSEAIDFKNKEIERLMEIIEQQNKLLLNSQMLQSKALSNAEILLLEKKEELKQRQEERSKKKRFLFW